MKIERIRKSHKKEIVIGTILLVVIGGALTFKLTHSKYRVTQSINLATGKINYKVPDFKVMAMYKNDNGTNYTEITSMPSSGYVINEEKTYCTTDNKTQVKGKIKTVNGIHGISGLNKGDKCYLYFDKQLIASETILANVTVKSGTPTFSNVATTNEGVYQTSDGMYGGTTYYWRGAVTNNYVKFAGYCWRIIRINGDKTIRLIYDGATCHANGTNTSDSIAVTSQAYNWDRKQSYYVGWTQNGTQRTLSGTASNAKSQTEIWYTNNLASYTSKIVDGKFCNDRDVGQPLSSDSGYVTQWSANGTKFAYSGAKRLYEDYNPIFSCPSGDVYTLKVGLITADEVEFAGGKNENNSQYYLYNGQEYWTMSPYIWNNIGARVFRVNSSGYLSAEGVDGTTIGLRPVINLKSDITFSSGNGTQNSPYVVN